MLQVVTEGVYFLYDQGTLVYVGESNNIYGRIGQHIQSGEKKFDSFEIYPCNDRKRLEGFLIETLKPKYNIAPGKCYNFGRETFCDMFPSQSIEECIDCYNKKYNTYTLDEVAEILGTYKRCVCKVIARYGEKIPVFKIDGIWKFKKDWVDENKDTLWCMIDD